MADKKENPDQTKKFRMQIVDENGQIIKSETFFEINKNGNKEGIRTITLLPREKITSQKNFNTEWVNYILASRGLKKKKDEEAAIVYGVLYLGPKTEIDGIKVFNQDIADKNDNFNKFEKHLQDLFGKDYCL